MARKKDFSLTSKGDFKITFYDEKAFVEWQEKKDDFSKPCLRFDDFFRFLYSLFFLPSHKQNHIKLKVNIERSRGIAT